MSHERISEKKDSNIVYTCIVSICTIVLCIYYYYLKKCSYVTSIRTIKSVK